MKIFLRQVPPEGMIVSQVVQPGALDLTPEDLNVLSPIELQARVIKAGDQLCVTVEARATYGFNCARCLTEVTGPRTDRFEIFRDLDPTMDEVDIGEDIREELIVAVGIPVVLCRPDCAGICPNCGHDLNHEACVCPPDLQNPVTVRRADDPSTDDAGQ